MSAEKNTEQKSAITMLLGKIMTDPTKNIAYFLVSAAILILTGTTLTIGPKTLQYLNHLPEIANDLRIVNMKVNDVDGNLVGWDGEQALVNYLNQKGIQYEELQPMELSQIKLMVLDQRKQNKINLQKMMSELIEDGNN
jgi:hypothetical protein